MKHDSYTYIHTHGHVLYFSPSWISSILAYYNTYKPYITHKTRSKLTFLLQLLTWLQLDNLYDFEFFLLQQQLHLVNHPLLGRKWFLENFCKFFLWKLLLAEMALSFSPLSLVLAFLEISRTLCGIRWLSHLIYWPNFI